MNKEALVTGHERKKAFLREAIKEGVYLQMPRNTSPAQWSKQRKIGFRYAFQDVTLEELGIEYGGTRENTRVLNHKFLDNIYINSPPQLQAQYPRGIIPDRKPLGQKRREGRSEAAGGRSLRIKEAIEKRGITEVEANDIDDIVKDARVTRQQVLASKPVLENWGISIHRVEDSYADFAQKARNEEDDKRLQEILGSFSVSSLKHFLHRDSNHETLITASAIANEKGFHAHARSVRFIAETIEKEEIPIRRIKRFRKNGKLFSSYYVVLAKHTDRIGDALKNDPALQRFR